MLYGYICILFFTFFIGISSFAQKITHNDAAALKGADLNDSRRPSVQAKEAGKEMKKQNKVYMRELKRTKKQMDKRNKKKLKRIVLKTKTKKVRHYKDHSKNSDTTPKEIPQK